MFWREKCLGRFVAGCLVHLIISLMEAWRNAISSFKELYCHKTISGDEHLVIKFHYERNCEQDLLLISCSDLSTSFWEQRISFQDMKHMKEEMDCELDLWDDFIIRLKDGIISDMVYVKDRGGYIKIVVDCFCEGEPLAYQFRLIPTRDNVQQQISDLILDMTKQLQHAHKLEKEYKQLKQQMNQLQNQVDTIQSQNHCFLLDDQEQFHVNENKAKPNTGVQQRKKIQHLRRKPGYSLVNPHSRRKIAKGAKIGE